MATTRSPSPNPSGPRTPDAAAVGRKSCTSIPSSMSEHHQRNVGCRSPSPSPRASIGHMENERDSNGCTKSSASRARSPFTGAMPSSSGKGTTKNFMAPTISASSKAVPASPRRRILAEKNEAAPSAVVRSFLTSLADESPVPEARREVGPGPRPRQDAAKVPKDSSDMTSVVDEPRTADLEIKNLRASGVLSPCRFSPAAPIDHLDVDPSLPPYNPHTNFLSPRPRFLHYRPNPRIEQYLLDESGLTDDIGDGRRLEDSFTSESCEDTQGYAEEEQSTNLQKDCEEVSSSSVVEEVMGGAGGGIPVPESESDGKASGKGRSSHCYKLTSFILVLAIACFFGSFMGCPVMTSSMLKTPPDVSAMNHFHAIEHYLAASSASLEELGRRFGDWSFNILAYYATINSTLPREEFGPIFLANFTASNVEQISDIGYYHIAGLLSNEQISQDNEKEQRLQEETREDDVHDDEKSGIDVTQEEIREDDVHDDEKSGIDVTQEEIREDDVHDDEKSGIDVTQDLVKIPPFERDVEDEVYEDEKIGIDVTQDLVKISPFVRDEEDETMGVHEVDVYGNVPQDDTVYENHKSGIDVTQDAAEDVLLEAEESGTKEMVEEEGDDAVETENNGLHKAKGSQHDSASLSSASQTQQSGSEETPLASGDEHEVSSNSNLREFISAYGSNGKLVTGFSSVVLLLGALFAFLVKQKRTLSMDKFEVSPAKAKVGISKSVSGSSESHGQARGSPYENNPVDTMLGDSGPSEFSSSLQHSTSVGRLRSTGRDTAEDALSQERALRRDSIVSSSSFSYGSFTTYERRSAKKGNGDEEVMTPVRRSSRIRSKIASP